MVRLRRSRWLHAHYGMGLAANRPTSYRTKGPCCFRNPPSTALSLGPRCLHYARSLAFLSWKGRTRCHMSVSPREPRVRILLAPAGSPRLFPPLPMPRSEARFMKTPSGYLERAATREPRSRSRRNRPHGRALFPPTVPNPVIYYDQATRCTLPCCWGTPAPCEVFFAGLMNHALATTERATNPGMAASQVFAAASAPAPAQLHDDSASAKVAIRDEVWRRRKRLRFAWTRNQN